MPTLQFKEKNIIRYHPLAVSFHTMDELPGFYFLTEKVFYLSLPVFKD